MAAGNTLTVKITAIDNATKQIEAVNKKLAAMRAPAERMGKALDKFGKLSGFKNIASGIDRIGKAAFSTAEAVGKIIAPLGALTGAASLAGVYKMVSAWGDFGNKLRLTATNLGMMPSHLSAMEGAMRLAGGSAEGMDKVLGSLGTKMQNAAAFRDPEAMRMFQMIGFDPHSKKKGAGPFEAKSSEEALPEILDKIKNFSGNAASRQRLMEGLGIFDPTLIKMSSEELKNYMERARQLQGVTDGTVEESGRFYHSQTELQMSVEGFTTTLSAKLSPTLREIMDSMSEWLLKNREWISTKITDYVKDFVTWCKAVWPEVKQIADKIDGIVQAFGGWKKVLGLLVAIELTSWVSKMVLSLNPLTLALAAIALTIAKVNSFGEKGGGGDPATMPVNSPLWNGIDRKEQLNYANSPASQEERKKMGAIDENPNKFSWFNPGSWFGHNKNADGTRNVAGEVPGQPGDKPSSGGITGFLSRAFGGGGGGAPPGAKTTVPGPAAPPGPEIPPTVADSAAGSAVGNFKGIGGRLMGDLQKDLGLTKEQAAGAVGNLGHESMGFSKQQEINPVGGGRGGLGWAQWTGPRRVEFEKWAKDHNLPTSSYAANKGFYEHELQTSEHASLLDLQKQTTVAGAALSVEQKNERAGVVNMDSRYKYANMAADLAPPIAPPSVQTAAIKGSADVNVNLNGAPQGSTATASTKGNLFNAPNVAMGMQGAIAA